MSLHPLFEGEVAGFGFGFFSFFNIRSVLYNDVPVMLLAMNQQSVYVHALIEAWSCLAVQMLKSVRLLIKIKYLPKCFF